MTERGDGFQDPGGLPPSEKFHQPIISAIVARYNKLKTTMGNEDEVIDTAGKALNLMIPNNGHNNLIDVIASDENGYSSANIGHYDPGLKKFLFYPEIVTDTEAATLNDSIISIRSEAIKRNSGHNYDAEIISDLRRKHREVLEKDGLIGKIVDRYLNRPEDQQSDPDEDLGEILYGLSEFSKENHVGPLSFQFTLEKEETFAELLIDDRTSYFICLAPKFGGMNKDDVNLTRPEDVFKFSEFVVSIALQGSYFIKNGVKYRMSDADIEVGSLNFGGAKDTYIPDENLVTKNEFDQILELAMELKRLKATNQPNLDTEFVALKEE